MPLPRPIARFNRAVTNPILGRIARFTPGFGIVHHVGRKSGRAYAVPVNVFRQGPGEYLFALTYGSGSDWVRNVLAAGECDLETRRNLVHLVDPVLEIDREKTWASLPVKMFLRILGVDEVLRLHVR